MKHEHAPTIIGSIGIRTLVACSCGREFLGRGSFVDHEAVENARAQAKASQPTR